MKHRTLIIAVKESKSEVTQLCPTLCDPVDGSPPGSSIHGIHQARILEWVGISFFRGSSQPRDWTQVSHIAGRYFTLWDTRAMVGEWKPELFSRFATGLLFKFVFILFKNIVLKYSWFTMLYLVACIQQKITFEVTA